MSLFWKKKPEKEYEWVTAHPCHCGNGEFIFIGGGPGYSCTKCGAFYMEQCLEPRMKYVEKDRQV